MLHDDQVEYIPGMHGWFSIQKLINAISHIYIHIIEKTNNKIITKDAEKYYLKSRTHS